MNADKRLKSYFRKNLSKTDLPPLPPQAIIPERPDRRGVLAGAMMPAAAVVVMLTLFLFMSTSAVGKETLLEEMLYWMPEAHYEVVSFSDYTGPAESEHYPLWKKLHSFLGHALLYLPEGIGESSTARLSGMATIEDVPEDERVYNLSGPQKLNSYSVILNEFAADEVAQALARSVLTEVGEVSGVKIYSYRIGSRKRENFLAVPESNLIVRASEKKLVVAMLEAGLGLAQSVVPEDFLLNLQQMRNDSNYRWGFTATKYAQETRLKAMKQAGRSESQLKWQVEKIALTPEVSLSASGIDEARGVYEIRVQVYPDAKTAQKALEMKNNTITVYSREEGNKLSEKHKGEGKTIVYPTSTREFDELIKKQTEVAVRKNMVISVNWRSDGEMEARVKSNKAVRARMAKERAEREARAKQQANQ